MKTTTTPKDFLNELNAFKARLSIVITEYEAIRQEAYDAKEAIYETPDDEPLTTEQEANYEYNRDKYLNYDDALEELEELKRQLKWTINEIETLDTFYGEDA